MTESVRQSRDSEKERDRERERVRNREIERDGERGKEWTFIFKVDIDRETAKGE